jgi:hypothetical protein
VLPQREIRYYFSILKLMLLLLASLAFVANGWPMIHAGAHPIIAWLGVGFFGLGALVILGELILTVIFRLPMLDKPALQITDDGISSVLPFTPWAHSFVPWADVARINIRRWRYARGRSFASLVVHVRNPDAYMSQKAQRFAEAWDPSMKDTVITVPLIFIFVWVSATRRAQMLERIKTTFAPELIQHNIWIDQEERLL